MAIHIRRREFISTLGGVVAAWPLAARAQQAPLPVIGFLGTQSGGPLSASRVGGFRLGLAELRYVEGRNVAIEYRWNEGHYDRLPALADDLVRRQVTVIAATTQDAALAAKAATSMIPIVFNIDGDPVAFGLVASLNWPGGNVTGVSMFSAELVANGWACSMRFFLKAQRLARSSIRAMPIPRAKCESCGARHARSGWSSHVRNASSVGDLDGAVASLVQAGAQALFVAADPFFAYQRDRLVALAAKHRLPAVYEWPDFVQGGGVLSYGTSIVDAYRQVGSLRRAILKGEKPADLPVMRRPSSSWRST